MTKPSTSNSNVAVGVAAGIAGLFVGRYVYKRIKNRKAQD